MTTISCELGDRRKLACTIFNEAETAADPTDLTFKILEPDGTVTTYIYGTDEQLAKDSTGHYHVYWDCTQAGRHWWRFEATGPLMVADEAAFRVRPSNIPATP